MAASFLACDRELAVRIARQGGRHDAVDGPGERQLRRRAEGVVGGLARAGVDAGDGNVEDIR